MQEPASPVHNARFQAVRSGRTKARLLLLEQLRQAIDTEPAALDARPDLSAESLGNIRSRVSILVGTLVVRLNREGFAGSDRLYTMRDGLASGLPIPARDLDWLKAAIAG